MAITTCSQEIATSFASSRASGRTTSIWYRRTTDADASIAQALAAGFNIRRLDATAVGLTFDETSTLDAVAAVVEALGGTPLSPDEFDAVPDGLPPAAHRDGEFLTQTVFSRYHSEHEMLRYLRRLSDRDLALDRTMIPLGSCTMKLNATSEMLPITWPEFADVHPFAPADQVAGYTTMIADLEARLATITGYDRVSVQPNAGSQGELAGLLAIRGYHRSRGDDQRTVCLIPSSAHGTNAASAVMAGMNVVVVSCDDRGNVDLDDVRAKIGSVGDRLAAIMITYPSTHGVFESEVRALCDMIHDAGGQVYVDGANLNALVGHARPGEFGADVSHLNLHKTFCIPHGGGGPGVGPVACKSHLAPFRPGGERGIGAIASAPHGSASILPISWMYVAMMGGEGLRAATESAILAANYVAKRLASHYPVLYSGPGGLVAHECILDLRPLKATSGIEAEDVAKRLIDYGFHAPTMSFPVPGTLMVEPTESESKYELDRFIDAMIAIRGEIRAIEEGDLDRADNPLKRAPHTAASVADDAWAHKYSRSLAAYPPGVNRQSKYWPPVARVDNVYGDRNLFCSCIPVTDIETQVA